MSDCRSIIPSLPRERRERASEREKESSEKEAKGGEIERYISCNSAIEIRKVARRNYAINDPLSTIDDTEMRLREKQIAYRYKTCMTRAYIHENKNQFPWKKHAIFLYRCINIEIWFSVRVVVLPRPLIRPRWNPCRQWERKKKQRGLCTNKCLRESHRQSREREKNTKKKREKVSLSRPLRERLFRN